MLIAPDVYFYCFSPGFSSTGEYFSSNTIILGREEKIIIDPGVSVFWPELKKKIEADGLDPAGFKMTLLTHCHPDHLDAGRILSRDYGLPLAMSAPEAEFLKNGTDFFFDSWKLPKPAEPPLALPAGSFKLGDQRLDLYLTPGHSPGGFSIHWPDRKLLIVGDTYFPGTIGAIDYPGGSPADMYVSVALLEALPEVELVLCGHCEAIKGRARVLTNYEMLNAEIAAKKAAGII